MEQRNDTPPGDRIARELPRFGRRLSRALREGMDSGDFGRMGREIEAGARDFAGEMKSAFDPGTQQKPAETGAPAEDLPQTKNVPERRSAFRSRMPGSISGAVWAAAGLVFGVPFAVAGLTSLALGILEGAAILLPFAAAALGAAAGGFALRRRARRFSRYRDAFGGASFGSVEEIALSAGQPPERTRKDLRRMIATGACPEGHFDESGSCFIVDDVTYAEYLDARRAYEEKKKAERAEQEQNQKDPQRAALQAVENEGREYLREIRAANDELPGEEISAKLDRLETVSGRIFRCVEEHPAKLPELRRFLHYYMPTTLHLVQKYREFEAQPVRGDNIAKAEAEIERALDTVNAAFANLLDTLYADDAIDISADVSALEGMLKQEGLTGSDFTRRAASPEEPESTEPKKTGGNV